MTWKERFVQFSRKAHCFTFLERIYGQCGDFDNFDAHKRDLAKTCCVWPETSVWYNFHGKRTVWPFWREFQASVTNWQLWCSKMRFGQNVLRMTYNFHEKRTVCPFWKEFGTSVTILRSLTLTNLISPKRAAHDLKRAFCTIFMKSAPCFRFGENFRPVWRFWELWRSKIRFGQNVLRMTWKKRSVQFSWKAHCFPVLKTISGQCDDFDNYDAPKCDLAKTCCSWPKKSVLYNFHEKRTVFPFRREFQASETILRTLTLTNLIWPKRAAHDLKKAFCTIFMESALFSRFEENFRPVWRFWELWRSKIRLGQNVLRMTWNERFVQFSWKAHCFPVLFNFYEKRTVFPFWREFEGSVTILRTLTLTNEKRTVFPFWREFEDSVTILTILTLTNAIWPKRAAHDLQF